MITPGSKREQFAGTGIVDRAYWRMLPNFRPQRPPTLGRFFPLAFPPACTARTQGEGQMKRNSLEIGDRVKLFPESLAWKGEFRLRDKIGEVTEIRDDGRITVRFQNGRLLMGRAAEGFEKFESGLR